MLFHFLHQKGVIGHTQSPKFFVKMDSRFQITCFFIQNCQIVMSTGMVCIHFRALFKTDLAISSCPNFFRPRTNYSRHQCFWGPLKWPSYNFESLSVNLSSQSIPHQYYCRVWHNRASSRSPRNPSIAWLYSRNSLCMTPILL